MSLTIKKGDTPGSFTVTDATTGAFARYPVGGYKLISQSNNRCFLINTGTGERLFDNVLPTDITNGDTNTPFTSFAELDLYIATNFFSKASGGTGISASSIPGALNTVVGLANFKQSLGITNKNSNGVGAGGIDIQHLGDSLTAGANSSNYLFDSWTHLLKVKLQKKFNPDGVIGGYGFMPITLGYTDNSIITKFGNTVALNQNFGVMGLSIGFPAGNNGMYLRLNGGNDIAKRTAADAVQLVGWKFADYNNARWDTFVGAAGAIGTGIKSGVHDQSVGSGFHGGVRFGSGPEPADTDKITLNPIADNYIQVAGGAAGTDVAYDGFICYNGDFDCGIRTHNLAYYGRKITEQFKFITEQYGGSIGSFNTWGTGARTGGAKNVKLVTMNWISNDCGYGDHPETDLATFVDLYGQAIDYVLSLPSKPSVLLIIPQMANDAALASRTEVGERWEDFRQAIYNLQKTRSSNVAILDLFKYFGEQPMGNNAFADTPFARAGYYAGDHIHWSDIGQAHFADLAYQVIT